MPTVSARVIWSTIGSVDSVRKALRSRVHRRVRAWCGSLRRSGSIDSQTLPIPSRYVFLAVGQALDEGTISSPSRHPSAALLGAKSMDPVTNQAKPIFKIARSRLERVGVDSEGSA
jgi:hypothetical protein